MNKVTISLCGKDKKAQVRFNKEAVRNFSLLGKQILWGYDTESDSLVFKENITGRDIMKWETQGGCSIPKSFAKKVIGTWQIKKKENTYFCEKTIGKNDSLVGKRFGKLVVEGFYGIEKRQRIWICRCDCGNQSMVATGKLKSGIKKSCGCSQNETYMDRKNNVIHFVNGENLSIAEIARRYNVPYDLLQRRLSRLHWDIEKAINTPSRKSHVNRRDEK